MDESPAPLAAVQDLEARGVPYRLFTHESPVTSLEEAAAARGQRPEQVVRSLLFRLAQGEYLMLLVAGPGKVSWAALRHHLGRSRLTTASRKELLEVAGADIGTVGPFGLPQPLPILVDESVLASPEVSLGAGRRGSALILAVPDLMRALDHPPTGRFLEA